jgi:hypothetical protein
VKWLLQPDVEAAARASQAVLLLAAADIQTSRIASSNLLVGICREADAFITLFLAMSHKDSFAAIDVFHIQLEKKIPF